MDQQSLVGLVARFVQLEANGKGYIGKCPMHADDGKSLRVDEKSWRCLSCGAHDGQSDAAGWLMAWSQCSREEAEHQLSNGGLPEVIPIQVPALNLTPFWGIKTLVNNPKWKVWIHERSEAVEAGRKLFPDRVHLGLRYHSTFDDLSILSGRFCVLLPMNRLSSLEKMRELAGRLLAEGHKEVRIIDLSKI